MLKSEISEFPGTEELAKSVEAENTYFRQLAEYASEVVQANLNGGVLTITGGLVLVDLDALLPGASLSFAIPTAISGGSQKAGISISPQTTINYPDPDTGPYSWISTSISYYDDGVDPPYWNITII